MLEYLWYMNVDDWTQCSVHEFIYTWYSPWIRDFVTNSNINIFLPISFLRKYIFRTMCYQMYRFWGQNSYFLIFWRVVSHLYAIAKNCKYRWYATFVIVQKLYILISYFLIFLFWLQIFFNHVPEWHPTPNNFFSQYYF